MTPGEAGGTEGGGGRGGGGGPRCHSKGLSGEMGL